MEEEVLQVQALTHMQEVAVQLDKEIMEAPQAQLLMLMLHLGVEVELGVLELPLLVDLMEG